MLFFYVNSCGMAGEGCERYEECDLKILLEKCYIVEEKEDEHCDILGWKALVPSGYACCLIITDREVDRKIAMKCILRIPELRSLEYYGAMGKDGIRKLDPGTLNDQQKSEIVETIKKFAPESDNVLKIKFETRR